MLFRSQVAERRGRQGSGRKFPKHDLASYSGGQQKLGVGEGQSDAEGTARSIVHAIDRGDGRRIGPSDGRLRPDLSYAANANFSVAGGGDEHLDTKPIDLGSLRIGLCSF
jgi:hypothetical protein